MRSLQLIFTAGLLAACNTAYAAGNVNGSIGFRQLDENEWAPVDRQLGGGVQADFALGRTLPLHISVGLQASVDQNDSEGYEVTMAVADISAGLKLMPRSGVFRPYVGLGVASVGVSLELDDGYDDDDSDQSFGYYAGGGALFRIGRHFNLGVDLRWVGGTDVELFYEKSDVDSFVASALIGYGWD